MSIEQPKENFQEKSDSGVVEKAKEWMRRHSRLLVLSAVLLGSGAGYEKGRMVANNKSQNAIEELEGNIDQISRENKAITNLEIGEESTIREGDNVIIKTTISSPEAVNVEEGDNESGTRAEVLATVDKDGKLVKLEIRNLVATSSEALKQQTEVIKPQGKGYELTETERRGAGPSKEAGYGVSFPSEQGDRFTE